MKLKITVIVIFILAILCFSATHYKEIELLKEMPSKGYSVYREINKAKGMLVIFDGYPGGYDDPEGWAK
ncbi:MAG: hypothetical protein GX660_08530, partial [Clostridiaceae bacterium]|nr:hypothetical protein [Clostridiaceae bacterium]